MQRYFVQLSFKGTNYHGWQIQPNALSVQETVEKAFSTVLREDISVTGAGRTDTGVHSSFYILHFDASKKIEDTQKLVFRMNGFLPPDVAIQKIWSVNREAHARFSALSRTYKYYITTQKSPFQTETSFFFHGELDVNKMNDAAKSLFEYSDFTSFSRLHTDVKTNFCKIYRAEWKKENGTLCFEIKADRFLRNMVRAIVGTLLEVGKGKLSLEGFKKIIEQKDRGAAGASAPAQGLFLVDVEYPEEILLGE
ncbi:tRNA pseudouridine38-40 synthase [Mariniphaga anaerophila]|uniref:tRNA pseudouridine synthase A n=1 Tax=Mariniphaga anaerophila TaxID=1484053 RepID=A0A1M5E669_9BACT|nr:tRNA pseudouridine(38-40) synthase TruA [Mariniphaga anaerophila]SHF74562.1 tRNA pseudouridine38-40 synthase [Mariniphaga anaerophila]